MPGPAVSDQPAPLLPSKLSSPCALNLHRPPPVCCSSGLLAREALSHPFFTRGDYSGLKHASLPAELPQVFPTE